MRDDTYHSRFCFICSNLCCVTTLLRLLKLVVYILIFSLVINDWGLVQFKSLILFFSPIFCFALVMWAQISLLRCVRIAIWRSLITLWKNLNVNTHGKYYLKPWACFWEIFIWSFHQKYFTKVGQNITDAVQCMVSSRI